MTPPKTLSPFPLRRQSRIFALLLSLLFSWSPVSSFTGDGAGGIPGLILTTDMITNFSDFSAAYLNPALLTGIDQSEFTFGASSAHEI